MAKTTETYIRTTDAPAQALDAQYFNDPGTRTQGMTFVPNLPFREMAAMQDRLQPIFGEASDQIFVIDPRVADLEDDEPVVVASGVCAFPKEYNVNLTPVKGPGSSLWYDAQSGDPIPLPQSISEAVDIVIGNPPPLTIPNLMKAGGIAKAPTVLIEEVRFYTDWMLEKLARNAGVELPVESLAIAYPDERDKLEVYVREQFARNRQAFVVLRRSVQATDDLQPLMTIEDVNTPYREAVDDQVARWQRDLPGGEALDISGLRAAAYYSSALLRAYCALGVLGAEDRLVIAEGAGNVLPVRNNAPFNVAIQTAFDDLARANEGPLIAAFPSPSTSPILRKEPLELAPVASVPSTRQPNLQQYIQWPKGGYSAAIGPVMRWSYGVPGTPALREAQLAALRSAGRSPAEEFLLETMQRVVQEVLDETE